MDVVRVSRRPARLGDSCAGASPPGLSPPLPRFAQIEPIGRCNLACRMCTVNDRVDEVGQMPLQRFAELLDAMPQLEQVHLQGLGEPMLHPQFFDMVELAVSRGLWVSANTNLTLLTEARARRCIASGMSALSVSIDGASAEVFESIRRGASFAKVLRNLRRLTDERDRVGSPLGVRGVMVLMRSNLEELPALVRLLREHRVFELLVQRLAGDLAQPDLPPGYIPIRNYVAAAELSAADLPRANAVFSQARALADALGVRLHLPRLEPREPTHPPGTGMPRCGWPWEQLYVTAAGEMLPCCMVATADRASFGRVFDAHPSRPADVAARWHGDAAKAFRQALAGDGEPPTVCRSCALFNGRF